MAEMRALGLTSLKMGTCGANGTQGTTLTQIGAIVEGTAILSSDAPDQFEDRVEGYMNPVMVVALNLGKTQIAFSIKDTNSSNLLKFFGGSTAASKWTAATTPAIITQSLEIVTKPNKLSLNGQKFEFPAVQVISKWNAPFKKDGPAQLDIVCTVLSPVNGSGVEQPCMFVTDL
jgi:hypothetical protein